MAVAAISMAAIDELLLESAEPIQQNIELEIDTAETTLRE